MTCTPSPWPPMSEWPTNLMPFAATGFILPSILAPCRRCRRACAGNPAEYRAVSESRTTRIVEPEDAAHQLAGGVQAADQLAVRVDDLPVGVDLQAAEAERDAAGYRVGLEWRRVQRVGPIAFIYFQ